MAIEKFEGYFPVEEDEDCSELAIDPQWELIQKKTFTAWCNAHLRKVNESIEVINVDFRDGLKLMRLLEVISGDHLPKPDKGKMRFHKITNVNKALDFITSKGVKLVSIGAEEIVDGNVKMTLGMIWTIILRFAIQDIQIEDSSAKEGLLLWCKRQTASYKNVNVTNFHNSFKDGLAFCAIIHRNRPDLIAYASLNSKNPAANLRVAFETAENQLDIPIMIDPEDIVNSVKPDERSIMAYVSMYYHKFAGENKASMGANRIANAIKLREESSRLIGEYETLSSDLLSWIHQKITYFSARDPLLTVSTVEQLQSEFRKYRREEKPTKMHDKANLETKYSTIQTQLRLSKRSPYVPDADKYISKVSSRWSELEVADKSYQQWILDELQRLRRVEYLIKKFEMRCNTHEAWSKDKPQLLSDDKYRKSTLAELRALIRRHEAFQSELVANQDRVERIHDLMKELENLQYHDMTTVNGRYSTISATTNEIEKLSNTRKEELERLLPILEKIDLLHLDFAKQAAPFKIWMEQTEEDLRDTPILHTTAEMKRYLNAHQQFEATMGDTQKQMDSLIGCIGEIDALAQGIENPYSTIKLKDLTTLWEVIKDLCKKRSESFRAEEQREVNNDKLRKQFSEKATEFDQWLQKQKAAILHVTMESTDSLEKQRDSLANMEIEFSMHKPKLDELEQCNQAIEDAYVFDNPLTTLSMPELHVAWEHLFTSLHLSINVIENQILTRDSRGLTAEQMTDLRSCFRHFDRDETGRLEPPEFKACLVSLGHSFGEESKGEASDFNRLMLQIDPGQTGYVTFDAFLNFMTRETADDDTAEQIIQSFKAMAGEKGYVNEDDIRRFLSPADADYCIGRMKRKNGPMGDSGALDYEQFAQEIYR